MKIELDELELATVKSALTFFDECMSAFDENRTPKFLPFQCVDDTLGALTGEEIRGLLERLEA